VNDFHFLHRWLSSELSSHSCNIKINLPWYAQLGTQTQEKLCTCSRTSEMEETMVIKANFWFDNSFFVCFSVTYSSRSTVLRFNQEHCIDLQYLSMHTGSVQKRVFSMDPCANIDLGGLSICQDKYQEY